MDNKIFNSLLDNFCNKPSNNGGDVLSDWLKEQGEEKLGQQLLAKSASQPFPQANRRVLRARPFVVIWRRQPNQSWVSGFSVELFVQFLQAATGERNIEWVGNGNGHALDIYIMSTGDVETVSERALQLMPLLDYIHSSGVHCRFIDKNDPDFIWNDKPEYHDEEQRRINV